MVQKTDNFNSFFFLTGAHKLQSFGLAGTATKRAKGGYKATTASSWVIFFFLFFFFELLAVVAL
ncbi:BQ5605_C003g02015 [Microbotryum silenes-dioicae]|uniref:BQ5605_C003g02015 protein n=1 Tax=Microbotryum silenes-dioicae TaxID=796604 RepID=A0A2X0M0K3_9BASI|nr:BQ5605_C003g02015 [Microbotryum silenes-dioicae]